jgi:hypothetical protein
MKGDAIVCDYFNGTVTVYPHCVIGASVKTGSVYVTTISLDEIKATTTELFIEALNKFDMKYKEALQLIRENKLEEDFKEDDDEDM